MPQVATLGSLSSHGGIIVTAASTVAANGQPIAVTGSLHACPIQGHGVTPMVSTSTVTVSGLSVVRVGVDYSGCGATIVIGSPTVEAS